MNNNLITQWIAQILDKFKAKNPTLFVVIQAVLVITQFAISYLIEVGLLEGTDLITKVLQAIGYGLMILVGSRTTQFVNKDKAVG